MRDDLGNWIVKRKRHIEKQEQQALKILEDCGVSVSELAKLWKEQKAAQLSLRARKPISITMICTLISQGRCSRSTQKRA